MSRSVLNEILTNGLTLAHTHQEALSKAEFKYIVAALESRAIPTPRLLIKNHKPRRNGEYPTRLVVPATNFTAGFANLGYRGIKALFENHGVTFDRHTIVQASDLKGKLEGLNIRCNFDTVVSFDAVNMYPSITFAMVRRAVTFFANSLPQREKRSIALCLKFIRYAMGHTLLTFQGEYYEYGAEEEIDVKGLTIGGFESD